MGGDGGRRCDEDTDPDEDVHHPQDRCRDGFPVRSHRGFGLIVSVWKTFNPSGSGCRRRLAISEVDGAQTGSTRSSERFGQMTELLPFAAYCGLDARSVTKTW